MAEPVARVIAARRTVRVAAALLIGQFVLCVVIGWLTLGAARSGPGGRPPGTDALAGPPVAAPSTGAGHAPAPSSTTSPATTSRTAPASGPSREARQAPAAASDAGRRPPASATPLLAGEPPVDSVAPRSPAPPAPDAGPSTLDPTARSGIAAPPPASVPVPASPSAGPSAPVTDGPVRPGGRCGVEGADAETDDGVAVRCLPAGDGTLRWRIV
ncbi:hypothetical protein [Mangrovihabitans endophyticus]|uniref:Uncharacterized protein n=1 Tax=Mangrovihabitans endophyticus TaxID=1751298 RepID=A0A8J3FPE3_9ACTN|nr:hypothetical protein [Mangrovihabitans endophyticus]GGK98915.1 hypothetical protein GCM10012284_36540 [Mangrovihabitans endophyticus]